jgi:catechol 2,3-dioxygenase-like lactoylglutathione lyase family enzyme
MSSNLTRAFESSPFALTLLSENLAESKNFYGKGLGLTVVYEDDVSAVYRCGQTVINLLADSQANELLEPAKLAPVNSGVRAVYTLRCSDVDAAVSELAAAGVELLNGPIDRPWGVRTASFQDPSGHTWELANHV